MSRLLKIEKNSSCVNFTHLLQKMNLFTFELIFISSSWRLYLNIKVIILNKRLEWYKERSLLAYRAIQNNLDSFAATLFNEIKKTQL